MVGMMKEKANNPITSSEAMKIMEQGKYMMKHGPGGIYLEGRTEVRMITDAQLDGNGDVVAPDGTVIYPAERPMSGRR